METVHAQHHSDDFLEGTVYDPAEAVTRLVSTVAAVPEVQPDFQPRQDVPSARTFQSQGCHSTITAADLSERWYIGLVQATKTLQATTQCLIQSALFPLARQYKADHMFERPRIKGIVFTDTMDGRHKSLDGNRHAQIFATSDFFAVAYPMEKKSQAGQGLKQFISDYGVPDVLVCDGSGEQTGKKTEFTEQI
jgi:hypothetical protein